MGMRVYLAVFDDALRCESRVMQVFDRQGIRAAFFASERAEGKVSMRVVADAGICGESRLMALLLRLEGVCELRSCSLDDEVAQPG